MRGTGGFFEAMKTSNENGRPLSRRAIAAKRTNRSRSSSSMSAADRALQAELVSLREENARLRMASHAQPDLHLSVERLRAKTSDHVITGPGAELADEADHLWHVLAEALAIREGLLSACQELVVAAGSIEVRLKSLLPKLNIEARIDEELETFIDLTDHESDHVIDPESDRDETAPLAN